MSFKNGVHPRHNLLLALWNSVVTSQSPADQSCSNAQNRKSWFYAETFWKPKHSRLRLCQGTCPRRLEVKPQVLPALLTAVNGSAIFLLFFLVVLKPMVGKDSTTEPHSQPLIRLSNANCFSMWLEFMLLTSVHTFLH